MKKSDNLYWFVLYVKPRNEKKVALKLQEIGINVYCPLVSSMHNWSDRKKKVEVPLIPSYVFVQLKESERDSVFQVQGIVRYVFWLGKPAVVKDHEISILKEWLATNLIDYTLEKIKPGDRMRIKNGPFEGKEGVVHEVSKNRIQLFLEDLGIKITLTKN